MKKLILGLVVAMATAVTWAATGPIRLSGKIESTVADNYGLELGTVYDIEDILDVEKYVDWGPEIFNVYYAQLQNAHENFENDSLLVAPVGTLTLTLVGNIDIPYLDQVGYQTSHDLDFVLIGEGYSYKSKSGLVVTSRTKLTIKSGTFDCLLSTKVGGTLVIEGGSFSADPTAYVDTTKYDISKAGGLFVVTEKGDGPGPVSEPEGKIEFDTNVLESARAVSSDFDAGFKLSFVADEKTLAEYGTRTVDLALSFASNVVAKTAVFAVKTDSGWVVSTNEEAIAADTVVKILQPAPTLNDVAANGVEFAIGGQTESLSGNVASFSAALTGGDKTIQLSTMSRTFGHGYFGPDAPAGDPLPITGKDVVAYFKFDDPEDRGANSGISESAITNLQNGATYTDAGRRGGALVVNSTDPSVFGMLDSPYDWAGAFPNDLQRPPYDSELKKYYNRHAGSNAWTIAFWYKPDPATKPVIWEDALAGTLPGLASGIKLDHDFVNLFDGCWHHIVITFNARNWGDSANPIEVYCDGGHWDGKCGWRESWHGDNSQFGMPATFDAKEGTLSIGGNINLFGDLTIEIEGISVSTSIPFKGVIDDLLILNRWMAADGAQKLYQTGDAYIFHVCSDELDENGQLNSYKDLVGVVNQYWSEYKGRGGWDSNVGWSSFWWEHNDWQVTYPRDYIPEKYMEGEEQIKYAGGGYDVSYCDYLVDEGSVFMPVKNFGLSTVFMGASLTLGRVDGSTGDFYLYSGNGGHKEITVNDLRLNNGVIRTAAANAVTNLNGSATVNDDFAIVPDSNAKQKLVLSASLKGEDEVTLTIGRNDVYDDLTVTLAGDASAFVGTLDVTAGATLELPVAGESVDDLTSYDGTQMQALAGEGCVKLVLADDVQLVEGTNLLAQLPKDAGIAERFTTNLESDENFEVSVEVVEEESKTQVFLVVKEVEQPEPPEPPEPEEPVTPGEEVECESAQAATNLVETINADKQNRIEVPMVVVTDADIAAYLGYLKARVVDETKVVVDLDSGKEEDLEEELNAAFTSDSVAGLSDSAAPLTVTGAIPGLYYWVEGGVELDAITESGAAQQATSEQKTLNLAKPGLGVTTKGFFKLAVGVAEPKTE